MNGAVAVRAQQSQIFEVCGDRVGSFRQGSAMVDLANVCRKAWIDARYEEPADFAHTHKLSIWAAHRLSLRAGESRVAFPSYVEEEPRIPFDR